MTDIKKFEQSLSTLLERFEGIQKENAELRRKVLELETEQSELQDRSEHASDKIDQMISRLKSFNTM